MKKILINKCNHGFSLSEAQLALFPGVELSMIDRADPSLIKSFEEGDRRGDGGSTLTIVEIPEHDCYLIRAYEGVEDIYYSASAIESL